MTSLYSTPRISPADSVNSCGSLGVSGSMTSSYELPPSGGRHKHRANAPLPPPPPTRVDRQRTLADRVLDGAYQIQRRAVPN